MTALSSLQTTSNANIALTGRPPYRTFPVTPVKTHFFPLHTLPTNEAFRKSARQLFHKTHLQFAEWSLRCGEPAADPIRQIDDDVLSRLPCHWVSEKN